MSNTLEQPSVQPRMTPDAMIDKYIQLRDAKAAVVERHKKELEPYNKLMDALEAWLLEALNAGKLSRMGSPHGTAYKELRTSAKVVDWKQTLQYIRERDYWDLLEARVSKLAAQAIIEETKQPIPGVETSSEWVCNVRRA